MGPRGHGFGFLHLLGGLVGMALFFAVLLGLAALAFKVAKKKGWIQGRPGGPRGPRHEPGAPHPHHQGPSSALTILDERLARGEIEVDDYKIRRDALTGNSFPPFHQPPAPPSAPTPPPTTQEPHA